MVVEFTMEDNYKVLLEKIQHILHVERQCGYTFLKGTFGAANNYVVAPCDLFGSEEDKSFQFKSLLRYVEQTILKPWSDNQSEFLCLTYHEDDSLNQMNCLSVLTAFAFAKGDRTCLEEVKSYFTCLDQYHMYHPKVGFLMNNLGIMFTEVALYEESDECFRIANICFQQQKHCLKNAVVTLNQAFLKKVVGEYEKAADLTTAAASLCHDISMRKANDAQLPATLLGRIADMLKEFGNYQMLKKILTTVVHFDIPGADKTATAVLSRKLMKTQLGGMERKIEAKEVKDFISHLLALLAKPDASKISMNAELLRIVIIAAKIFRSIGQCKEACKLLTKLQSIFLLVHGENSFLYGSLLYQMGRFLHGSGRFNDAETALKQAEGILICYCGENHHSVALCRSVLGSCILLKGNAKDALEYLNDALTVFKKLNPNHPEVGEIHLKVAFLYSEEGNFQQAQETVQEAEAIFISSCGEVSLKTANAYFQVGMIFQRFKELRMPAVGKIQEGIKMMVNLGINVSHPDVMFWRSLLGSLKQSLGLVKEAEKCFIDVQNSVGGTGSKETEIITPVKFLHSRDRADVRGGKSSFLQIAQFISLINLVHMERANKRIQYLDKLVSCLKEEQVQEIQMSDFAGQDLYLFTHRIPSFNRPAVLVIHTFDPLADRLGADDDDGTDSKMFLSSSAEKSPFSLFLRIQSRGLDVKEINCMTSSFRESVEILFLEPKFRKGFVGGKDVYVELPTQTDIFSLSSYLDCLPLLVELELTKSQGLYNDFDYLTSWQSSVDSTTHPAPHVSYFSYSCVNQRETAFVWDHLIQNFGQQLALNGFQEGMISDVSLEENVARFIVQESNLFLTIDVRNLSVIVKCCTIKESGSNCHCSSMRNMLTVTIESLFEILNVDIESSVQLGCEGVHGFVLGNDDHDGNCSQSVDKDLDLVGSGPTLETSNSMVTCLCSISGGAEADLKKWTAGKLHNENADIIHPLCHPCDNCQHVDVGLCLLECLLNQSRPVLHTREKELNNGEPTSNDVNGCVSHITHSSLSSSIFSSATSSSLSSVPAHPSTFSLAGDSLFTSTKSPSESLSSVDKLKEYNADSSSDVVSVCGSRELLSDNALRITKCSGLSVSLPKEPSVPVDTCAFSQSSYKECLTAEQSCSFSETQNTKQSKPFTIENINRPEELKISSSDQKAAGQNISSKDKDSSISNDSKLSATQCVEDLCANQSSKLEDPLQSIQGPFSGASSDKVDTGTATVDFFRTLLANLEDELAASQRDHCELEQQFRKLEEKLKESEEEKRELQADLGRFLFLEEKARRRGRLLGGATAVQEPGLLLHSRLLEISNSLSSTEMENIKFLLKSKVNGFRLARITEAFELFEELEKNGLFSLNFIGQLLGGIQRYDLVEKLGIHAPLSRSRKGSNSSVESDHASSSAKSALVQDNILNEQTDGPEMKTQINYAPSSKNYFELTGIDENGTSLRADETDHGQSQCSSILSSGSSVEEDSDICLSSKSVENVVLVEDSPQSPIHSDVMFVSNSSRSSSDLLVNSDKTAPATSNSTLQASCEVDGFQVMSDGSQSASGYSNPSPTRWDTQGISHVMARPDNQPADEDGQLKGRCAGNGKERVVKSHDFCDGAVMAVPYCTKTIPECTKRDSVISSDSILARTHNIANGGSVFSTQQHVFSEDEREITPPSSDATDWKRLGARPKEPQRTVDGQVPKEPVVYITDGLAGDFLARHTQDKALHDSIYQTDVGSLFNDIPSQGTSFIDGDISQFSRAQPYFGDCQAASRTEPHGRTGHSLVSGSSRHLGGSSYVEPFSDNSDLWHSHLGNDSSSLYSNYLSRNTSTAANNYSLQSDFVHNSSRFAGVDHFDRQTYLPSAKQTPFPPIASDPVLNSYPGMAGSSFADPSWTGAALTLPGDPVHNAPRFSSFLSEQLTDPAHDANRFAGNDAASVFTSNQGTDEPAQKANFALGNSRTTTGNIDDDANSSAQYQLGNSTTFDGVLAARSTHDTPVLEPHLGDADNNSALNNTDFGTDSIEASDNSLLALERRVAEACALVERVLREREEREQFGREIERKEQLIREQRARERREREERELREAENWPQQQEAINARSQWLCEHYQRHCRVRFPCCTQFYPCHRCHNISKACDNEEAKACHATHLKCSHCQHEQEIGEDSAKCRKCGGKMSAYFCPICKHFTSVDKNPYHCEKCGICRIHEDKSFHCEVCNVCLDKRLEGNHKCRPDSGHDECCICLEDAFSGCQILPCSHKVHRECAIAMIQNGIRTCPICRHPLYSQSRE